MLPFFRKIRWQLARDNQFFKYSRYAIGEIVLVMVGILLALQVNNWNEKRKNNLKLEVYQTRLIQELIKDTIALHNFLIEINAEAKKWSDIKTEIEKPSATIDTLIGYFVESNIGYMPVFSDKNDATYKSLVSSSEIEFFDEGQRILLMDFYNNIEPQYAFILKWQSEVVYDFEETFSQYGWLTKRNKDNLIFKQLRKDMDQNKFVLMFDAVVGRRTFFYNNRFKTSAEEILNETRQVLDSLHNWHK